jgi:hypothetical protein
MSDLVNLQLRAGLRKLETAALNKHLPSQE